MIAKKLALPLVLAAAALLALTGCEGSDSSTPAQYPLTVNFSGMTPHLGHAVWLRVVHVETQNEVARISVDPVTSSVFSVTLPETLIAGERYQIDFYADNNRNHRYDVPPADHAWRRFIGPLPAGPATLNFTHDPVWIDIRWPG